MSESKEDKFRFGLTGFAIAVGGAAIALGIVANGNRGDAARAAVQRNEAIFQADPYSLGADQQRVQDFRDNERNLGIAAGAAAVTAAGLLILEAYTRNRSTVGE